MNAHDDLLSGLANCRTHRKRNLIAALRVVAISPKGDPLHRVPSSPELVLGSGKEWAGMVVPVGVIVGWTPVVDGAERLSIATAAQIAANRTRVKQAMMTLVLRWIGPTVRIPSGASIQLVAVLVLASVVMQLTLRKPPRTNIGAVPGSRSPC
jgi:hypothetical protein